MGKTDSFFIKGKLSVILDGGAGSSGKGKIGSYIVKNADNVGFVCNTFTPNASHTIVDVDENGNRKEYVYKNLNSCAHDHHKFEKMYIGHGAAINLDALLEEIKMAKIPHHKLGISPITPIVQEIDQDYEGGKCDFSGEPFDKMDTQGGTIKTGTTASGSGAARARKIMRKSNITLARDVEELKPYICDVSEEIMDRLDRGQSGLLEIAQGFQLSYGLPKFYPFVTSRNCSVAAGFDDMMLSPHYLGNVCINFRTYPIRIHSYKYLSKETPKKDHKGNMNPQKVKVDDKEFEAELQLPADISEYQSEIIEWAKGWKHNTGLDTENIGSNVTIPGVGSFKNLKISETVGQGGSEINCDITYDEFTPENAQEPRFLTWDEVQVGVPHEKIPSYSGEWYPDQEELNWDIITSKSGAPHKILECTTLTKLPRRVATFSKINLEEAIRYNQTPHNVFISLNFVNYIDWDMYKVTDSISSKVRSFLDRNISPICRKYDNVSLKFLGTSEFTDDNIVLASAGNPM